MKKNAILLVAAIAAVTMGLTSCATTVHYTSNRPAVIDVKGKTAVAVLNFGIDPAVMTENPLYRFNALDQRDERTPYANEITALTYSTVGASSYLSVVEAAAVQKALIDKTLNPAQAYLTGYVSKVYDFKEVSELKSETLEDGTIRMWCDVRHRYSIDVVFAFIDAETGALMGSKTYSSNPVETEWMDSTYSQPSPMTYLRAPISEIVKMFVADLQPSSVQLSVSLLEDKAKDSTMKYANELAKNGKVLDAANVYYEHYMATGLFEAGYNAALLCLASGEFDEAYSIMSALVTTTQDKRAIKQLTIIEREMDYAKRYAEQQNQ